MARWPSGGTVNALYRLGDDVVVRLPLRKGGAEDVVREQDWLPRLASRLPTAMALTDVWEDALRTPDRGEPQVWLHADLRPGNLLVDGGRLSAVIDFGCMGVGDPACDLFPAWNLLPVTGREVFRDALGVDDAMWSRGGADALAGLDRAAALSADESGDGGKRSAGDSGGAGRRLRSSP